MKHCPSCGYDSPDDSSFCVRCGAFFPDGRPDAPAGAAAPSGPAIDPGASMDQGFRDMSGDDFPSAVSRWSEAIKAGQTVDDETYDRMLSECIGAIMRSVSKPGTHSRAGIADLALLIDDRDLITDLLAGLAERGEHLGYQRELMNTANEYLFLAIESFLVYTDLEDMEGICGDAVSVFEGMLGRIDTLEPVESKFPPRDYLENYAGFFRLLGDQISQARAKVGQETLDYLSDYWADKSGSRFYDALMGAANMNAQLVGTGWMGSKLAVKARDIQIAAFLTMYIAPSKQS